MIKSIRPSLNWNKTKMPMINQADCLDRQRPQQQHQHSHEQVLIELRKTVAIEALLTKSQNLSKQ
jgi:hypothetical protein